MPFPKPALANSSPRSRASQCRSPSPSWPMPFPEPELANSNPWSRAGCPHSCVACWLSRSRVAFWVSLFACRALAVPIPLLHAGCPVPLSNSGCLFACHALAVLVPWSQASWPCSHAERWLALSCACRLVGGTLAGGHTIFFVVQISGCPPYRYQDWETVHPG